MESYTVQQRIEIIQQYYGNSRSVILTQRALRENYGWHNRPNARYIRRLVKKFESTGSVADKQTPVHRRNARSNENITAVRDSVRDSPNISIPRRAQELGLSTTSTWRILRKDLGLHPYKIQLTQELKPNDHRLRRSFANWALEQLEVDPNFNQKIIFSDEAHFWLNGYVNKQNCRIWAENNPQEILERPLHPQKVTVWCGLWAGGVIGPYFFETAEGRALTVNAERYRAMINDFLWPRLLDMDLEDKFFQQDGATCHTSGETIALLREKFPGRVISRNGDVNWPPRSCDLTPLDFFLWGYVKSLVYANKPRTTQELKENIRREIAGVEPQLCQNVVENWTSRMRATKRSRGGHLYDIIFHY